MDKGAKISDCGTYRYSLTRIWDWNKPFVLFIMLNPSKADAEQDDPTIKRCIDFAQRWGHGGLLVANLFAYRATNPEDLYFHATGLNNDIVGPENDLWIKALSANANTIVFGWGNNGGLDNRCAEVSALFSNAQCFGLTKKGHPKHPLFLSKNTPLIPFTKKRQ